MSGEGGTAAGTPPSGAAAMVGSVGAGGVLVGTIFEGSPSPVGIRGCTVGGGAVGGASATDFAGPEGDGETGGDGSGGSAGGGADAVSGTAAAGRAACSRDFKRSRPPTITPSTTTPIATPLRSAQIGARAPAAAHEAHGRHDPLNLGRDAGTRRILELSAVFFRHQIRKLLRDGGKEIVPRCLRLTRIPVGEFYVQIADEHLAMSLGEAVETFCARGFRELEEAVGAILFFCLKLGGEEVRVQAESRIPPAQRARRPAFFGFSMASCMSSAACSFPVSAAIAIPM